MPPELFYAQNQVSVVLFTAVPIFYIGIVGDKSIIGVLIYVINHWFPKNYTSALISKISLQFRIIFRGF